MKILKKAFEFACVGAMLGVREYIAETGIDPASGVDTEKAESVVATLDDIWAHVKKTGTLAGYGGEKPTDLN